MRKTEMTDADELVRLDRKHSFHHLAQHKVFETQEPIIMVEGKGCMLKDIRGREYLDGVSGGVWCVNVGYGQDSIAEAVFEQLKKMPYYAPAAGNIPAILMAEKVTSFLPNIERLYISNSGSEANEKAFKMSRQYNRLKYPEKDKYKIIYRHRDYHGTTITALSATGQPERKIGYEPLVPGFLEIPATDCYRCPFGKSYPNCNIECARALETTINLEGADTVAAVIVEPITAGGGILVPVEEYFSVLQEVCRKYDVLLIIDEVVCGFGRTGKMFGHQHYNVDPDMVTMAKGMASAYMPISATAVKEDIFKAFVNDPSDKMAYFRDVSTYAGCAGSCAATLETIRLMEEQDMCKKSEVMGGYLLESLKELQESFPIIGDVRGKGLFAGIELVEDRRTKVPVTEKIMGQVVGSAMAEGVLLGKMNRSVPGFNNVIQFAPALIVTKEEIDRMVSACRNGLEKVSE